VSISVFFLAGLGAQVVTEIGQEKMHHCGSWQIDYSLNNYKTVLSNLSSLATLTCRDTPAEGKIVEIGWLSPVTVAAS
jgi:hypothetical protein